MPILEGSVYIYRIGEEGSGTKLRFPSDTDGYQSFEEIRNKCLETGTLWEDPEFPLSEATLKEDPGNLLWKRPHEIQKEYYKNNNKVVFSAQESGDDSAICRFDVHQGGIGNCGSVAAFASSALHADVREFVMPSDNTFEPGQYCGAFHFRYYRQGRWLDVVIDDRLPCNSRSGPHSIAPVEADGFAEYWPCLVEKIRAKLGNSFEGNKTGGNTIGLEGFTGGVMEDIDSTQPDSFARLLKRSKNGAVAELASQAGKQGWVKGHGYSVTGFSEVKTLDGETVQLIRARNPWGNTEFKGKWSDSSPEWDRVDQETKDRLGLIVRDDGEFWFDFKDFQELVGTKNVLICTVNPLELNETRAFDWEYVKVIKDSWSEDHIDGVFGPDAQVEFNIKTAGPTWTTVSYSTLFENYGAPFEKDIRVGFMLWKLDEKDVVPFAQKELPKKQWKKYSAGRMGKVHYTSWNLEPGRYVLATYTREIPTDVSGGYSLRIIWEK